MNLHDAMAAVEAAVPDPESGLPEEIFLFVSRLNPLINVDLLVREDALGTLLTWRDDRHYGPGWHVPGGIIRYKERREDRVRATALRELGAAVEFDSAPILITETIGSDRERGHFISLLYLCRLQSPPAEHLKARSKHPEPGQWRWHSCCPDNLIAEQRVYAEWIGIP